MGGGEGGVECRSESVSHRDKQANVAVKVTTEIWT